MLEVAWDGGLDGQDEPVAKDVDEPASRGLLGQAVWRRFSRQVRSSTTLIEVWDQDAPSTFARGELVQTFASDGDFYAALTRQGWEPLPRTAGFRTRGRVRIRRFVSCCVRPTTPT